MRLVFLLPIYFLVNQICAQTPDNSHIGPVAEFVQRTYQAMSCILNAWAFYRDDAQQKSGDIKYNFNNFYKNISKNYKGLKTRIDSTYSTPITNFLNRISAAINTLSSLLDVLISNIASQEAIFKPMTDNLAKFGYIYSMSSMSKSVLAQKSCVPSIVEESRKLFLIVRDGLIRCTNQTLALPIVDSQLAFAYYYANNKFDEISKCFANKVTRNDNCFNLANLAGNAALIEGYFGNATTYLNIKYKFISSYQPDCIKAVQIDVANQILTLKSAGKTCEACLTCTGRVSFVAPQIDDNCDIANPNDVSYFASVFYNASTFLQILQTTWNNYKQDSLEKLVKIDGSSHLTDRGVYATYIDFYRCCNSFPTTSPVFKYYLYVFQVSADHVGDIYFGKIKDLINNNLTVDFRLLTDVAIINSHTRLYNYIYNNWNNPTCVNGLMQIFWNGTDAMSSWWDLISGNVIITDEIEIEYFYGNQVWYNKSLELLACFNNVYSNSSQTLKTKATTCFNQSVSTLNATTTVQLINSFDRVGNILAKVYRSLSSVIKDIYKYGAIPLLQDSLDQVDFSTAVYSCN